MRHFAMRGVHLLCLVVFLANGSSQKQLPKPAEFDTMRDMARWERGAVGNIVHKIVTTSASEGHGSAQGDELWSTAQHPDDDDGHDDDGHEVAEGVIEHSGDGSDQGSEAEHSGDASNNAAPSGSGSAAEGSQDVNSQDDGDDQASEGSTAVHLASDVAEQGRLWNELTSMEKDADVMVKQAGHQHGQRFQSAEDKLFNGALKALHDVDQIDDDIETHGDGDEHGDLDGDSQDDATGSEDDMPKAPIRGRISSVFPADGEQRRRLLWCDGKNT